jgi:choline dehydrogenase
VASSQTYDYVIVGAGSAGCVLANRLSEDPGVSVLLLEAGKRDRHPTIKIPAAFAKQFKTKLDWDYQTEPEPGCEGRSLFVPRGKSLGGSSSMNAMVYMRGRPQDYDRWRELGCAGWGWEDVLPYFKRAETNSRGASELRGGEGPLQVSDPRSPSILSKRFVAAAEARGIPGNRDFNGDTQEGAGLVQVTQRGGRRWSTADAYLRPVAERENLTVATGRHVLRMELEGERAIGVRHRGGRGGEEVARAAREVVLAAGAINSPQLLMLSGIGPAEHLREHGIEPAIEAPAVGANLHDHPYVVAVWESTIGRSLADAERPKALLEYLLRRSGPLSSSVAEACAFVRSRPDLPEADLQFHFAPAYFVENGFAKHEDHAMTFGPVVITPRSRGELLLRSGDPLAKPRFRTGALSEPEDVAALVAGVKLARELAATEPLASASGAELFPGPSVRDDAELERDARRRVELLYHPVGTCRMGSDDEAVVDPELRVRGVDGLRVADASVMPVIVAGNTNAATVMIGERAADLVRGRSVVPSESVSRAL